MALQIISKNNVYSHLYTDELETLHLNLLTNKLHDYHYNIEQIVASKLSNEEQNIKVNIKNIDIEETPIVIDQQTYYQLRISIRIPVVANDFLIHIDNMKLEIQYENQDYLSIQLGELYYQFHDIESELSLENLSATYENYKGNQTVGGVLLDIKNNCICSCFFVAFNLFLLYTN